MPYEGLIAKGGQWNGQITVAHHLIDQPLRWRNPRKVFVNSMSDLFHENVPEYVIDRIFAVMAMAERHKFQILTKRPQRMMEYCKKLESRADDIAKAAVNHWGGEDPDNLYDWVQELISEAPLQNVWLGVSVEDQKTADERIQPLLQTPAAVRWISAEPLLGRVDLCEHLGIWWNQTMECFESTSDRFNPHGIDWVVVGGESGPGARPMHPMWAQTLRNQCVAAGVPFFFKQWGEWGYDRHESDTTGAREHRTIFCGVIAKRVGKKKSGRILDGREWNEYPEPKP